MNATATVPANERQALAWARAAILPTVRAFTADLSAYRNTYRYGVFTYCRHERDARNIARALLDALLWNDPIWNEPWDWGDDWARTAARWASMASERIFEHHCSCAGYGSRFDPAVNCTDRSNPHEPVRSGCERWNLIDRYVPECKRCKQ